MVRLSKEDMKVLAHCCDSGNGDYTRELDSVLVDQEYLVATDTRVMARIRHGGEVEERFLVHGDAIKIALKVPKAVEFGIDGGQIVCLDRNENEIVTIGKTMDAEFRYPDYKRIIPNRVAKTVRFSQRREIEGVLIVNHVTVDSKLIPDIDGGEIWLNSNTQPIGIKSSDGDTVIMIMPLVGFFDEVDFSKEHGVKERG